jgi:NADPH:quinone reductase-like Zn-dependent oxidoreductase
MAKAVKFDEYGGTEVLKVVEVEVPPPGPGRVLVRMRAAGINPGEAMIRTGALHERWPATFPSGEGSDLAGVVEAVGEGVEQWSPGDEVLGWSHERSSHAELVEVPAEQLVRKPAGLAWDQAGALYIVGITAGGAVEALDPQPGETVAVSGAAGGVGSIVVQLARLRGAKVIGIASDSNREWLESVGATQLAYGDRLADRLRATAPDGIDGFVDAFGPEYVDAAVEVGVAPERIVTVISFERAAEVGAKTVRSAEVTSAAALAELAEQAGAGEFEIPIAARYPLAEVRDAYDVLEQRHTRGKIVLVP